MSKIILMQGLPGSGKTTKAKEIMLRDGNVVRVGRDQLRTMLHFDKWNGKNEDLTKKAQIAVVKAMLEAGKVVLIDDTNIQQSRIDSWKNFARENNVQIEWVKMETPLYECIRRDILREKPVGMDVIIAMAMQAGIYPKPQKGFVICDLDGTLADITHRLHFVRDLPEGQKKDWKSFFEAIPGDTPRMEVVDMVMRHEGAGYEIAFVSGRSDDYRDITEAWLEKVFKGYPVHKLLLMRRSNDKREDVDVKRDIYEIYFKDKYPVVEVIDDRPSVIRMWLEQGLKVTDVGKGVEF